MSGIDAKSDAIHELVADGSAVERLATGFTFTEGPIWHPEEQVLYFSDMPGDVRRKVTLTGEVRWAFMGRAGVRFESKAQRKLDERGVAAIEYALVASLIALSLVAAFSRLGGSVETSFNRVDNAMVERTRVGL